jgi:hypothetical protein
MARRRKSARRRSSARRSVKTWRRKQGRAGLRMSSKGFRRAKRKGRVTTRRSTFMKYRRKAHNPAMQRTLRDGTTVVLHEHGAGKGRLQVMDRDGEVISDKVLETGRAVALFRRHKSGRRVKSRAAREDWSMLAADNPRRKRKTRGRGKSKGRRKVKTARRGRKSCRGRKGYKPRWKSKRCVRSRRSSKRGRARSRRNPAQFPTPFASAMNPRIRGREASAMRRVLKRHGYGCRR